MVFAGVFIGIVLIAYFFTFAQFFDRGYMAVVVFQAISSVLLVVALVFLKRVSFYCLHRLYGRKPGYRAFLAAIDASDLDKDEKILEERFGSSGMHA